MIAVRCIEKFRDKNNVIIGYRLQDSQGVTKDVYPDQLKVAIRNQQITVINLTLTSDNRLVDNTPDQIKQVQQPKSTEEQIKMLEIKAKALGFPIKTIGIGREKNYHSCKVISQSKDKHILCIPDGVTKLNEALWFTKNIRDLEGSIKVIGGKGLKDASDMFNECFKIKYIDLSSFDTSNLRKAIRMFSECLELEFIDLSSFDTSNIESEDDMHSMFYKCKKLKIKTTDPRVLEEYNNRFL